MDAETVVALLDLFEANGIAVWLDGGWGVDALLGKQSRAHGDLDVALDHGDVARLRDLLTAREYHDVPRDDTRECNFVLGGPART